MSYSIYTKSSHVLAVVALTVAIFFTSRAFAQSEISEESDDTLAEAIDRIYARYEDAVILEIKTNQPSRSDDEILETDISALGEHWSGLDRYALVKEIQSGNLEAAANRIVSAGNSVEEGGAYRILIELNSTSLLSQFQPRFISIAKLVASWDKSSSKEILGEKARREKYLKGYVLENLLLDQESAKKEYRDLLSSRSEKVENLSVDDAGNDEERGAIRRLKSLEGIEKEG